MIKAKVTIFDDETGEIREEDKIIGPCEIVTNKLGSVDLEDLDFDSSYVVKEYIFKFGLTIMTRIGE